MLKPAAALAALLLLSACGQSGALVLPDKPPPTKKPVPEAPAPAPASPEQP